LLADAESAPQRRRAEAESDADILPTRRCPCCGGRMIIVETFEGPRPLAFPVAKPAALAATAALAGARPSVTLANCKSRRPDRVSAGMGEMRTLCARSCAPGIRQMTA
jgi:hypothetical protein